MAPAECIRFAVFCRRSKAFFSFVLTLAGSVHSAFTNKFCKLIYKEKEEADVMKMQFNV